MSNKKFLVFFAVAALALLMAGPISAKTYVCFKTFGRCLENFKYFNPSPACTGDLETYYKGLTDGICYSDQTTCENICKAGGQNGKKFFVCKPNTANPATGTCDPHKKNGTEGAYTTQQACTDALKTDYGATEVKGRCYEENEYDTCRTACGASNNDYSYAVCILGDKKCELHRYSKYPNTAEGKRQCEADINNDKNYKGLAKGYCYLASELETTCKADCERATTFGKPGVCIFGKGCETHKFADTYENDPEWCQVTLTRDYGLNVTNGKCYARDEYSSDVNNITLTCNKECNATSTVATKKIGVCLKSEKKCVEHQRADFFKTTSGSYNIKKCTDYLSLGMDYKGVNTTGKCYNSEEMKTGGACDTECGSAVTENYYVCNKTTKTCESHKVQSYAGITDCNTALSSLYPDHNLTTDRCYTKAEFEGGVCGRDCVTNQTTSNYYVCNKTTKACELHKKQDYTNVDLCKADIRNQYYDHDPATDKCYLKTEFDNGVCGRECNPNNQAVGSKNVLIITKTLASRPKTSFPFGIPGMLDITSAGFAGYNFEVKNSLAGNLSGYDTIVYLMPSFDDLLTTAENAALEAWIKNGGKFIRFANAMAEQDNLEWNFSDLKTFKASINSSAGKTLTPFKILEENPLAAYTAAQSSYIDVSKMAYKNEIEAFGSSEIWPYKDSAWCNTVVHASNGTDDSVLAYRNYGQGIIIYNGIYFGSDFGASPKPGTDTLANNITQLWLNALRFTWKTNKLSCTKPIASNAVMPTPKKPGTVSVPKTFSDKFGLDYSPRVFASDVDPIGNYAVLCGTVNTGPSKDATIIFEYWNGANPSKKIRVGKMDVTTNDTFCQPVFDLATNATYYFVFRAYNGAGKVSSVPVEFKTTVPTAKELQIIKLFRGK